MELDGQPLVSKRVRLPDDLPLGYHEMTLDMAGETSRPRA